jgi:hypothetical protein
MERPLPKRRDLVVCQGSLKNTVHLTLAAAPATEDPHSLRLTAWENLIGGIVDRLEEAKTPHDVRRLIVELVNG